MAGVGRNLWLTATSLVLLALAAYLLRSTIWLCAPALHVARTEDFGTENGTDNYRGVAITNWTGFILKPRDLFDGTPLYTPTRRSFR